MKVLIADDHQLIREGIKRILADAPDVSAIGEASNAAQALEQLRENRWDILVLDLKLPGKSGLDLLIDLQIQMPKLPVLILSMYPEEQFAVRVIRRGASGYLTKAAATTEILPALRRILAGHKYFSPKVAEELAAVVRRDTQHPHELLTDREFEVFRLLAEGKSVSAIAADLGLSVKTVSSHRVRILTKMGLKTNAELVRYAIERTIVE
jgi:two-component system invasion response regulator UvrY